LSELKSAVRPYGIAIDYDDTFTTCPETWTRVIELLRSANANVFCVTARNPDRNPVLDFPGEVYYTNGKPKWAYMHELKVDVHIWIEDQPALVGQNPYREAFFG
jgi:hypothetical protein